MDLQNRSRPEALGQPSSPSLGPRLAPTHPTGCTVCVGRARQASPRRMALSLRQRFYRPRL